MQFLSELALNKPPYRILLYSKVQILQKLDHPHIVHYHEAFFDRKQDNLFIIQVGYALVLLFLSSTRVYKKAQVLSSFY